MLSHFIERKPQNRRIYELEQFDSDLPFWNQSERKLMWFMFFQTLKSTIHTIRIE